jgi:predicted TIM-barrel fold metal-dependent hydrolase
MTRLLGVDHSVVTDRPPAGSCDCHTHVFGPAHRFPYAAGRAYTPPDASIAALIALHAHLGIDRVVIVHPSPYGADNRCSVDAIQQIGLNRARGIAVIDAATTTADLYALDAAGMRGARLNLATVGIVDPTQAWPLLAATARQVAALGWHVQVFASLSLIATLADKLAELPTPVVIDHFGRPDAALGVHQPGFVALRRLVAGGEAYVKLSASYRISRAADHTDAAVFARTLIADNPDRMLWGTDWPHPGGSQRSAELLSLPEPLLQIDDGAALNRLSAWAGSADQRRRILVDNPSRLYGF